MRFYRSDDFFLLIFSTLICAFFVCVLSLLENIFEMIIGLVFILLIYSIFVLGYVGKVTIHKDKYVSLHGSINYNKNLGFTYTGGRSGGIRFTFSIANIKEIRRLNKKEIAKYKGIRLFVNTIRRESIFLTHVNKGVMISFKKSLEYTSPGPYVVFAPNIVPINEVYFSIANPDKFISDVNMLRRRTIMAKK